MATKKRYEYSIPSLGGVLRVRSEHAKSLIIRIPGRRTSPPFSGVSPALFAIDVVTRKMGRTNPAFDHRAVVSAVDTRLKEIESDFQGEIARLETFIANEKITSRAQYNSPVDYTYEITTPQIKRAADLIGHLDQIVELADTLWLTGQLSHDECEIYKNTKTKMLSKAFRNLISTGFAARKKAFEQATPEALETQKDIIEAEAKAAALDAESADSTAEATDTAVA